MTPEPMPTRLRREAARWGDSKLAELLTQAAEEMEAAGREGRKLICSYCGLVQTADTPEGKVTLAVEHMLVCEKRPELTLIRDIESILAATKAAGLVWFEDEDGAEGCRNERAEQAKAQLAASRAALRPLLDLLRETHAPVNDEWRDDEGVVHVSPKDYCGADGDAWPCPVALHVAALTGPAAGAANA